MCEYIVHPLTISSLPLSSSCCQSLRQLANSHGCYNLSKHNEWNSIEDLVIFATLSSSTGAVPLARRLKRHFTVIQVPDLKEDHIVMPLLLQSHCVSQGQQGAELEEQSSRMDSILDASLEVYHSTVRALKMSDLPGRSHYFFSLGSMESVFQV